MGCLVTEVVQMLSSVIKENPVALGSRQTDSFFISSNSEINIAIVRQLHFLFFDQERATYFHCKLCGSICPVYLALCRNISKQRKE